MINDEQQLKSLRQPCTAFITFNYAQGAILFRKYIKQTKENSEKFKIVKLYEGLQTNPKVLHGNEQPKILDYPIVIEDTQFPSDIKWEYKHKNH